MKRTIRLKMRTLLMLMGCFVILLTGSFYYINRSIPKSTITTSSENQRLSRLLSSHNYSFFNFINTHIYHQNQKKAMKYTTINGHDGNEILKNYERLSRNEDVIPNYVLNVALTQYFSGHLHSAQEILDNADTAKWNTIELEQRELIRIAIALNAPEKDIEGALSALSKIETPLYYRTTNTIKAYMALTLGVDVDYSKTSLIEPYTYGADAYELYFEELTPIIYALTRDISDAPQKSIRVKVTYKDKPYSGAVVYQPQTEDENPLNKVPVAITDQNGYATLPIYEENDYGIGLLMPWQLIHNAQGQMIGAGKGILTDGLDYDFTFHHGIEFSELTMADGVFKYAFSDPAGNEGTRYLIQINAVHDPTDKVKSNVSGSLSINGTNGELSIEKIRNDLTFSYMSRFSDEKPLKLENFLEPLYLSGTYGFHIAVMDRNAWRWNGCFSDALSTSLDIEGTDTLSEGDRYFQSGEVENAMDSYWAEGTKHSLSVLNALYSIHNQWDQVIKVLEEMSRKYGKSKAVFYDLFDAYHHVADYEKLEALIREQLLDEPSNVYLNIDLGHYIIRQGRYLEGLSYLKLVSNSDYAYANASLFLAGNQVDDLPEPINALAKSIHSHLDSTIFDAITKGQYQKAYETVLAMPSGDAKLYLKLLLEDAFDELKPEVEDFRTYYDETLGKIQNPDYVTLLKAMKKNHNWY